MSLVAEGEVVVITKENWRSIYEALTHRTALVLDAFDDKVFYYTRTIDNVVKDCVYFVINDEKSKFYSNFLNKWLEKIDDGGPVELDSGIMCLTDFKKKMDAEEVIGGEKTYLCGNRFNMVEMEIEAFPEMPEKCVEGNSNEWRAILSRDSSIFTENEYHIEFFYEHVHDHVTKCMGLEKCVGSVYDDDDDSTDVECIDEDTDTLKSTDEGDSDDSYAELKECIDELDYPDLYLS